MDGRLFLTVFVTVFLAELGDKTQLATLLYAAKEDSPLLTVFLAASAALVLSTAIGVVAGGFASRWLDPVWLRWIAGVGFIAVGIWTLLAR